MTKRESAATTSRASGTRILDDLRYDMRHTVRSLLASPGFTAVAILSLALGIGVNTVIFRVINAVSFRPLPAYHPDDLVELTHQGDDNSFTAAIWDEVQRRQNVFSDLLAYDQETFDLAASGEQRPVQGLYVSGNYFTTLGVPAYLGRTLIPSDDLPRGGSSGPVAVLSYGFWQREYGRDRSIIGQPLVLNHRSFEIVGVAPPGFFGVDVGDSFDVAIPLATEALIDGPDSLLKDRSEWWLHIIGRLRPGINSQQATAAMKVLAPAVYQGSLPDDLKGDQRTNFLSDTLNIRSAAKGLGSLRERYSHSLTLLMILVGAVLLIACANIANLLLARAKVRQREFAIRSALGAGRGRIVRQLLTESLMLSITGAALGVILSRWGAKLLVVAISTSKQPHFLDMSLDGRILAFIVGIALLTGILFGMAPALQLAGTDGSGAIKDGGRGLTSGRHQRRLGRALVVVQVALTMVLLIGAGLFVRSLYALLTQHLGFEPEGVLLVNPDFRDSNSAPEAQVLLASQLLDQLHEIRGVQSVSRSAVTPIGGQTWQWDIQTVGQGGNHPLHCFFNLVSSGYFRTMRTALLQGRDFTSQDAAGSPPVALLNESAARLLFQGEDPIGRAYRDKTRDTGKPLLVQVVGVVQDAKYRRLRDKIPPTIYLPISQFTGTKPVIGTYELRFSGGASDLQDRVKQTVSSLDPRIVVEFRLLADQVSDSLSQERLVATLTTLLGLLALVLATVGLYGVISYGIVQRTGEIGVRMALGATRGNVLLLVLGDVAKLLIAGLVLGIASSVASIQFVRSMLYGLLSYDPVSILGASLLLLVAAGMAGYFPARRAALLDPVRALREE